MKKHQTIALVSIIILAAVVVILIFASKKSTEVPAPTTTEQTTQPIPETVTSTPQETTKPEAPAPKPAQAPGTYTMAQVETHNSRTSCYTVVSGNVYDVTPWISQHPGGQFAILGMCGKDATDAFTGKHGGQARPESELASFKIGTLVQ